jgi:hypothetical protein
VPVDAGFAPMVFVRWHMHILDQNLPAGANKVYAFYIKNHSSSELYRADLATLPSLSSHPHFATKAEFADWCHNSKTDHVFYTMVQPEYSSMRSSGQNPFKLLHGIVADYDGAPEAIQAALPKLNFAEGKAPTWITTTFSGKARLIWAFERPVPVFTPEVISKFKQLLLKDLKLKMLLPGLDEGAWDNLHTPFELGTNWRQPRGDVRLASSLVMSMLHEAASKAKFKVDGPTIPLEVIAAEVERRWPNRWTGAFVDGAKGIRFWDHRADNPTGCTIRTNGVIAYTGECRFMHWSEILGPEFASQYQASRIGTAIDGVYHDGLDYWQKDEKGIWKSFKVSDMIRRLSVKNRLSTETRKGAASEVSAAITTIQDMKGVDGAFPCLFLRDEIVRDGIRTYLNISRVHVLPTVGTSRQWGEGFPWMAEYLLGLFGKEQLDVFLSWLAHFYNNAREGAPKKGHALFIAGEASSGKTLLSSRIIADMMGGSQEASSYLLGNTSFNEELFYHPVWTVDDAVAASDPKRHSSYSQLVKKVVANPHQEFHPKYKKSVSFKFNGRLIVTMNSDPVSIGMLPSIEQSILDKLIILKADKPGTSFDGADEKVRQELPAFCDYVSRWVIPDWLQTKPDECARFGHDSWHHPELLSTARDSSPSAGLMELLMKWRPLYFCKNKSKNWSGSATDLLCELKVTETIASIVDRISNNHATLGKHLQSLIQQGIPWIRYDRSTEQRRYTILRPDNLPLLDAPALRETHEGKNQ